MSVHLVFSEYSPSGLRMLSECSPISYFCHSNAELVLRYGLSAAVLCVLWVFSELIWAPAAAAAVPSIINGSTNSGESHN